MCTGIRFSDGRGSVYLARNLDWTSGYGQRVVLTPTGYAPRSPFGAVPGIRHATLGMGIVAEGTPLYFDCGNDAGLAVAGLNFPGYAAYAPGPVDGAVNVAAYEFPLWVCSQFATVDEVEAALQDVVVVDRPINETYPSSMLHWIVADATRAVVVEHTADGMHVFHDDVDVLTNQPGFGWHHENLRNYLNVSPDFPGDTGWAGRSSPRSARARTCAASRGTTTRRRGSSAPPTSTPTTRPRRARSRTSAAPSTRCSRSRWSREAP